MTNTDASNLRTSMHCRCACQPASRTWLARHPGSRRRIRRSWIGLTPGTGWICRSTRTNESRSGSRPMSVHARCVHRFRGWCRLIVRGRRTGRRCGCHRRRPCATVVPTVTLTGQRVDVDSSSSFDLDGRVVSHGWGSATERPPPEQHGAQLIGSRHGRDPTRSDRRSGSTDTASRLVKVEVPNRPPTSCSIPTSRIVRLVRRDLGA